MEDITEMEYIEPKKIMINGKEYSEGVEEKADDGTIFIIKIIN